MKTLGEGPFTSFLPWRGGEKRKSGESLEADIYFPVLHGPYGEDGTIQGLLEMADVPYVGAAVLASSLGMDKGFMKVLFRERNLPIVKFLLLQELDWKVRRKQILAEIKKKFRLPLFIKPTNLGSSVGITKVKDYAGTEEACEIAFAYDRKILVEQGIEGREIECSVLGNDDPSASLPGEIIPYREFYDYEDKYLEGRTAFGIPADLPSITVRKIQRLSVEAFKAIEASGMARVDFFIENKSGRVLVNEINTIPGFTEISMYPKLWEASGLPFPALVERLIELGLERHRSKKRVVTRAPS
jgi:D-alanine-D-alanine ligase